MKYLGVAGVLLGLSLLGVPALADEAKQPVPRVGQVVIESMGPASGTIPKGKLATIVNYIHADKHTWYKNGSRHTAKYRGFKFKVQHPVLGYWRLLKKLHRVS